MSSCANFPREADLWSALRNNADTVRQNQAFACVYTRCYPGILRFVAANSGADDDARILIQDAMVVLCAYCQRPGFEPTAAVCTLLQAIARRSWLAELRRRVKTQPTDFSNKAETNDDETEAEPSAPSLFAQYEASGAGSDEEETDTRQLRLAAVWPKLTQRCQDLLRMTYMEEKPDREIAALLGYAEDGIRVQRFQCKQRLKNLMNP